MSLLLSLYFLLSVLLSSLELQVSNFNRSFPLLSSTSTQIRHARLRSSAEVSAAGVGALLWHKAWYRAQDEGRTPAATQCSPKLPERVEAQSW